MNSLQIVKYFPIQKKITLSISIALVIEKSRQSPETVYALVKWRWQVAARSNIAIFICVMCVGVSLKLNFLGKSFDFPMRKETWVNSRAENKFSFRIGF